MSDLNSAERTEWFPGDVPPARAGVYERLNESTGITFFSKWIVEEGHFYFYEGWGRGDCDIEAAANESTFGIIQSQWPWRGLAKPWGEK